ncbi:uncharacterized protein PAC_09102 [Phialocephala subalpina]|uniref:Uncharacterized protein n=1 Tax=Phialocephala subalpina TaxID=576137 RepID=A0A1L7X2F8_9HELO|nr:uncharacterized protein PAC_09102 [Phialocephala subalpina]
MAPKSKSTRPQGIVKRKHVARQAQRLSRGTSDGHEFLEFKDGPKIITAFQFEQEIINKNGEEGAKMVIAAPETGIHKQDSPLHQSRSATESTTSSSYSPETTATNPSTSVISPTVHRLHRLATFWLGRPSTIEKYLSVINPFHKSHIRTLELQVPLREEQRRGCNPFKPSQTIAVLGSLASLDDPKIDFHHVGYHWRNVTEFRDEFLASLDEESVWLPLKGKLRKWRIDVTDTTWPWYEPSDKEYEVV